MYHGYAGAETRALSAFEVALWDIMGQAHYDAPLYHLLGGMTRDEIPTYNTCLSFGAIRDYEAWHDDAGALARSLIADEISAHENLALRPLQRAELRPADQAWRKSTWA